MDSGQPPPIHLAVRLELPEKEPRAFEYDFEQAVVTLGRDPSNDIQVPLTTVSRHHARLFFERGDYFLEDLGSTHGTKHNDRTLDKGEKRLLRAGDRITIVSFHIEFSVTKASPMDRQPGERTEQLTRRMVDEVLHSLGSAAERPSLRVMSGKEEGQRFVLNEDAAEIVIGRSPDCDVTLDDQNISRRHCLIKRDWHGFSAQDLGSRNGVLVNEQAVEGKQMLRDGDEIRIGGVKIAFIDPPSRFLDKMGGFDESLAAAATMLPEDEAAADEADPEEEAPVDDYAGAEDDLDPPADDLPEDAPPPFEPSVGEADDLAAQLPEEDRKVLESVVSGSSTFDFAILAVGAVILLGALGFALFMLM